MDIRELQDLYFCNWEHKFWGPASTLAPNAQLTLNHFHNASSVIDPALQEYFEIYWFEQGITGEVKLPGEWNYCYFQGKYYHLEKTKSDGFFENNGDLVEFFFYSVIYDEWSNDFLTNSVVVRGTLAKTGDYLLAARYIHAITPVVTNGNDVVYIDAQERELEKSEVSEARRKARELAKQEQEKYWKSTWKIGQITNFKTSSSDFIWGQQYYTFTPFLSLEKTLIYQLYGFLARDDLKVFDVDRKKILEETFNTVSGHTGQYYSIAASEDVSYFMSSTINKSKRIRYENLKVKQIEQLNPSTYEKDSSWARVKPYEKLKLDRRGYYELFLKLLDYGLLHTDTKTTRGYSLDYNRSTNKLSLNNRPPKAWRVGNRVWTIEELEKTDWYKVCKPYDQIGIDDDGRPLYFMGFDPTLYTDPDSTVVKGKSLLQHLRTLKAKNRIEVYDIPSDTYNYTRDGHSQQFRKPTIEIGNPALWYGSGEKVKQLFFPYDEINRYKKWSGGFIDLEKWKVNVTYRKDPETLKSLRWAELLNKSIDRGKQFGLQNSRLGYEIARRPGALPGSVQYFVPIYEDSDEGLTEDWIFGAGAIELHEIWEPKVKLRTCTPDSGFTKCIILAGHKLNLKDGDDYYNWLGTLSGSSDDEDSLYEIDLGALDDFLEKYRGKYVDVPKNNSPSPGSQGNYWYITNAIFATLPLGEGIPSSILETEYWVDTLSYYFSFNILSYIDWNSSVFQAGAPEAGSGRRFNYVDAVYNELEKQIRVTPILLDLGWSIAFCVIKNGKWHFELLVKDNDFLLEDVKCVRHVFSPKDIYRRDPDSIPSEEEVIQAINSSSVISVYGQEIPVRDRFILEGKDIDWRLNISSLKDKYQASSNFFLVEAQTPESLVRITLDIPKEGVFALQTFSAHEKRDTLMSYVNAESNRYYERSNLDLEKRKFHIDFERESKYLPGRRGADWSNWISGIFSYIGGAISAGAGVALMATGVGVAPGLGLLATGLGLVGGGVSLGTSLGNMRRQHREEDEERSDRFKYATENFRLRGEQMHIQHSEAERQEMVQIRNMANANTYGNTTHAINYQSFNEHFGTTDIHLAYYRPSGDVLERLKWYYQEFGYDLMVPDQWCFGITSIRGHIRFSQILENSSCSNQSIRALIEGRLLAGVRIVDLEGKSLGPHEYPDTVLYETCLTRYDQLNEQLLELNREREELRQERERLNKDIETHRGTIDEKDRLIEAKEAEIANKESELSKARQDIIDLNTRIGAIEGECKSKLDTKDEEYRSELASRDAVITNFESGLKQAMRLTGDVNRDSITAEARKLFNELSAAKGGLTTFRKWETAVKQALGIPDSTSAAITTNKIKENKDKLNKALEDIKGLEVAKAAEEAKLAKAIEDSRVKEEEFNSAMREELNKRTGVEQRLRAETALKEKAIKDKEDSLKAKEAEYNLALQAKETECAKAKEALEAKQKEELEKAKEPELTCAQFRRLAGHYTYNLSDPKLLEDIEKLCMVLAITIKYMLIFNVDQRFSNQHEFQSVFKDLYDISENDLVEGFIETFGASDWYKETINKWRPREWSGAEPAIANRARAEARREHMLLQYVDKTNDGRLYRGTDKDILNASITVLHDMDYSGVPNIDPVTKRPITYAGLREKAMSNLNPANLNHLKEVLDDLSVNIERVTMEYMIDVNTFDTSGRSEKCKGVLPTTHCDEVNFIRLCYAYLRFYDRIWDVVEDTDIPYGVLMGGMVKEAEQCEGILNFEIVKKVSKSTIYPAIGLYAYNPKWATWSVKEKTIRHGTLNHYLQIYEPYTSSKAYDDIKPVIPLTAGIRLYNRGYNKTVGDKQHHDLDWCYISYMDDKGNQPKLKDFYLSVEGNLLLTEYFNARSKYFNRLVQNMSRIFNGYRPQALTILTTLLKVVEDKKLKGPDVIVDSPSLVERINIDEVFGYETWKYALLHLLTMSQFRIRFKDHGRVNTDSLRVAKIEGIGFVVGRQQPFETWDNNKFIKGATDALNKMSTIYVSPDFAEAKDLFRWIYRNLKVWNDPTKGSNIERLITNLISLQRK